MDAAVLCLEGEALDWYQWKEDRKKIDSWAVSLCVNLVGLEAKMLMAQIIEKMIEWFN